MLLYYATRGRIHSNRRLRQFSSNFLFFDPFSLSRCESQKDCFSESTTPNCCSRDKNQSEEQVILLHRTKKEKRKRKGCSLHWFSSFLHLFLSFRVKSKVQTAQVPDKEGEVKDRRLLFAFAFFCYHASYISAVSVEKWSGISTRARREGLESLTGRARHISLQFCAWAK